MPLMESIALSRVRSVLHAGVTTDDSARPVIRRETHDDLLRLDL